MVFVDSIYDLQYYNQPDGAPCYCEQLAYPDDLQLQAVLSTLATSGFDIDVEVWSPDGLNRYEGDNNYFTTFIGNYQGTTYFGVKLKSFSPAMCLYKCWILRVIVTNNGQTLFDKFTQRYCQSACCDVPRNITFNPGQPQSLTRRPGNTPTAAPQLFKTQCGDPMIRIEVAFDCLDTFNGEFYGTPVVLQGTGFNFQKITNIAGRIKQRPREITRQISYNCKLQSSESFKPYLLESTGPEGIFPTWKMNELEGMFHANYIFISDFITNTEYQFAGGPIVIQPYKCWELWRLKTTMQSCTNGQTFGCSTDCAPANSSLSFIIPENYTGGQFFAESGQTLTDYTELLNYYATRDGVTGVEDVSEDFPTAEHAFTVTGSGYIPTSFYYDRRNARNRVFGEVAPIAPVIGCAAPTVTGLEVETDECATPTVSDYTVETDNGNTYDISGYGDWSGTGRIVTSGNTAVLNIVITNPTITPSSPLTAIQNQIVTTIDASQARPNAVIYIDYTQNEDLPAGSYVSIYPDGRVTFGGYANEYDMDGATVELTDIYYNLY